VSGLPPGHPARFSYRDDDAARAYAEDRFQRGTGPATDRRERRLLDLLLDEAGMKRGARVLDCPAGAGRLADLLARRGYAVTAADQSPEMLAHAGRSLAAAGVPPRRAVVDALSLPFGEGAFDLVLCHRLFHHLERPEQRRALLASLAAASAGPVIVSWFDSRSLQHLRRALRRRYRPSQRFAVSRAEFTADAAAAGLRPVRFRALRPLVSELTFTLLRPVDSSE
jgi:SAM-dependent methyltransferase